MSARKKTISRPASVTAGDLSKVVGVAKHDEELLDDALNATFPASDPVAELPTPQLTGKEVMDETLLDDALEFTFPASDPLSISSGYSHIKSLPELAPANVDHQINPMPGKKHR